MFRKVCFAAVCMVGIMCAVCLAIEPVVLPEIVVTPMRSDYDPHTLPYTTYAVGRGDIQGRKMSRTTPEALDEQPAILVQKTAHGQGSPFLRGFTGFRTLFLVDGIRLNNSIFRDGPNQYWNTVDPFTIDRMEIVKGPGSVMYGSDAIGGTVNALNDSPVDEGSGGRGTYRYSSAEDSHVMRAEGRVVQDEKWGLQAGATYKDFGNLHSGDDADRQEKTGYEEACFDAKAAYLINPNLAVTVAHQTVDQDDAWRTHKTIYGRSFHGTTVGNEKKRVLDQNRHLTYASLDGGEWDGFIDELHLILSYQRQEEEQFRIKSDDSSDRQGFDVDTLGISLSLISESDLGTWTYGAEYYHDDVDSFSRKFNADGSLKSIGVQGPVADESEYETLGIYVQNELPCGERLDLISGVRYNRIEADAGTFQDPVTKAASSFSESWDTVVGSVRAVYRLLPDIGLNLFAGVSQGFRAPNLSDLTRLDTARTDELETPSPDLDPEEYVAYEIGAKVRTDRFAMHCAYYYTDIKDMIVRTPTGRMIDMNYEVIKRNAGDGFVHGVEVAGEYDLTDLLTVWGNLTWMEGEVDTYPTSAADEVREPMSRMMPITGNVGLRYQASAACWLEGIVTMADRQDELSTRDARDTQRIPPGGTPGYAVFGVRGGWSVTEEVTLTAAVENIGDKEYRVHGSGINEAGRNFVMSLSYDF